MVPRRPLEQSWCKRSAAVSGASSTAAAHREQEATRTQHGDGNESQQGSSPQYSLLKVPKLTHQAKAVIKYLWQRTVRFWGLS